MSQPKMKLEDWLDDLCVRFIINLPQEDLSSVARICFQVEEAQWFYEDFIRPLDPTLPSMSLRSFCLRIFQHCPLLASFSVENHMRAFEEFLQYKTRVPVRGAILLNDAMDATVLVKGWKKGASWSFPRGKINKDEDDLDCAVREVYEETGFDIRDAGLVPPPDEIKFIDITMREQQMRLYVFRSIPTDTHFEPKTRKEISKIQWYRLSELPAFRKKGTNGQQDAAAPANAKKFYMVAPFLVPLKKWVGQQKKKDALRAETHALHAAHDDLLTEDDIGAQTEPATEMARITPAIDTLEGATKELRRLLKVQPATQGLQAPAPAADPARDKGEALLAILQRSAGASQLADSPARDASRHTPLELTYTEAPEPRTPHHHHPTQRMPLDQYPPPPAFPMQPRATQNRPAGMYNSYQYTQQTAAPPPPPPHQPQQNVRPQANVSHQQRLQDTVPLMHPQPLPPQVQKALLIRGIFASPSVPDSGAGPTTQTNAGMPYGAPQVPMPPQLPVNNKPPPSELNSHAVSLLNAFKTDGARHGEAKNVAAPAQAASLPLLRQGQPQQPSGWSNAGPASFSQPYGQMAPGAAIPIGGQPPAAEMSAAKPRPPTDSHRGALLDMFKQQVAKSPRRSEAHRNNGVVAGAPQAPQQPSPRDGRPPLSNGKAIEAAAQANGGPIQMNPELSLPFGAISLLTRPKDTEPKRGAGRNANKLPYSPGSESTATLKPAGPSPRNASQNLLAQIQAGRPVPVTLPPPQPQPAAGFEQSGHDYPRGPPSHRSSSFPASETGPRQQDGTKPDQKQKLLSLFGKPQAAALGPEEKGKGKEPATNALFDKIQAGGSGPPRTRLASLVPSTAADDEADRASRRGSQTPISPADRNFLLGYLESVSSGPLR